MKNISSNNILGNYYSGGLAEIVANPTPLTFTFFKHWFTGRGALGSVMNLLKLPYQALSDSPLVLKHGELLIDLSIEEKILYAKTIYKYKKQVNIHAVPQLKTDVKKSVNPTNIANTGRILLAQSNWIANPAKFVKFAEDLANLIPEKSAASLEEIDLVLQEKVWPRVVAVGLLAEFFEHFVAREAKEKHQEITSFVSSKVSESDWYFRSLSDQNEVREGRLEFSEYLKKYGFRADRDYELTYPRWYEIPHVIEKRINQSLELNRKNFGQLSVSGKLNNYIDADIKLQILRSEAKKKTLVHIDALRKAIFVRLHGKKDISEFTRNDILTGSFSLKETAAKSAQVKKQTNSLGRGIAVSRGEVSGIVKNVTSNSQTIEKNTVGIFPNASPEFAFQFPKCAGMIFLRGGQTSHGSIVAREFRIPALIDPAAEGISDGTKISMNGAIGEWKIIE